MRTKKKKESTFHFGHGGFQVDFLIHKETIKLSHDPNLELNMRSQIAPFKKSPNGRTGCVLSNRT
jgi:hypothetical protein